MSDLILEGVIAGYVHELSDRHGSEPAHDDAAAETGAAAVREDADC